MRRDSTESRESGGRHLGRGLRYHREGVHGGVVRVLTVYTAHQNTRNHCTCHKGRQVSRPGKPVAATYPLGRLDAESVLCGRISRIAGEVCSISALYISKQRMRLVCVEGWKLGADQDCLLFECCVQARIVRGRGRCTQGEEEGNAMVQAAGRIIVHGCGNYLGSSLRSFVPIKHRGIRTVFALQSSPGRGVCRKTEN